jgi:uncharacterized protein YjiS (DUF1127 family)
MSVMQTCHRPRFGQPRRGAGATKWIALIKTWHRRMEERRALALLNDMALRDIGINRCDAMTEVSKPFWRA